MSQTCQQPQAHPSRCGCVQTPSIEMMEQGSLAANYDISQETAGKVWEAMENSRKLRAAMPPAGGEVEVISGIDVVAASVLRFWAEDAHNIRCVRAEDFDAHVARLRAENSALQQGLNTADQRVDDLQKDKDRLDALEANYWDVRHHSSALGDTGDYTSSVEIVGQWMDKPNERVIGENYNENLRAAIDQAMTADAYPPARPEYPELDAALAEEDWHMNPCKQGHRDVGACQGKAFCHTCDETITAETTQQAFEQWNATHSAVPQ